ncbi:hypothetical protein [Arthrobacter pityocampae]|uniref:hypothetical protein n=1 Tax=Arthrobacter pityocampae TaxID=547334 RepID=UPI0037369628
MNRNTIHGIDLTAPGGLDALFAYNRARFGAAVMEAGAGGDGGAGGEGAGGDAGAGTGAGAAGTGEQGQNGADSGEGKPAEWDGKVESLPAGVQKMIRDLRKEDGDERIAKKTLDAIQKALNPEGGDEKPDAAKLAEQLAERQADLDARDNEAKQAKAELAVFRLSHKLGADPDALLDSRGFLAKLAGTDLTDDAALNQLIADTVNENPKFRLARAAGQSSADFSGGSGENAITQDKFNAMTPAEKNALFKSDPTLYRRLAG